jgi:hypothetical protein
LFIWARPTQFLFLGWPTRLSLPLPARPPHASDPVAPSSARTECAARVRRGRAAVGQDAVGTSPNYRGQAPRPNGATWCPCCWTPPLFPPSPFSSRLSRIAPPWPHPLPLCLAPPQPHVPRPVLQWRSLILHRSRARPCRAASAPFSTSR